MGDPSVMCQESGYELYEMGDNSTLGCCREKLTSKYTSTCLVGVVLKFWLPLVGCATDERKIMSLCMSTNRFVISHNVCLCTDLLASKVSILSVLLAFAVQ